jgi:hypothetical protein
MNLAFKSCGGIVMKIKTTARLALDILGVLLVFACGATAGRGQAFVSAKNGVDVGSCPVTAPCRTITYSLTQAGAGGTVNLVDSGNYEPFFVNKSVTVQAAPGIAAVITRNTPGFGVSVETDGVEFVTIRGLILNLPDNLLSGFPPPPSPGFKLVGGGTIVIERCIVRGFTVGIDASMVGSLYIRDTNISGGTTGMNLSSNYLTLRVTIERCQTRGGTALNATTVPSAMIRLSVSDSLFSGGSAGINVAPDATGFASVTLEHCEVSNSKYGIQAAGAGVAVRVSNSTIIENGMGLTATGGAALLSRGNNTVEANQINSDFTGTYSAK